MAGVTEGYNNHYHRSIRMTPLQAQTFDIYKLWKNQYGEIDDRYFKPIGYKYKLGDKVKISYLKTLFDREYSEKWSGEIFIIIDRKLNQNTPMYKLKDFNNDIIDGYFYEPELQPAYEDENTVYKIEKVIKKGRKRKSLKFSLIKSRKNTS